MSAKKDAIIVATILLLTNSFYSVIKTDGVADTTSVSDSIVASNTVKEDSFVEKRGEPTYDYVIGSDYLPHFRVFFWVPKDAKNYIPYADEGVKTDVSEHGPAEKWSVVETNKTRENEKLVFIYVPKTFVMLQGKGFQNKIHLQYK